MKQRFLKEGDVINITEGMHVYADVPMHFLYSNHLGDFSIEHGLIKIENDFSYFAGKYVVIKTAMEGGGTGHGANDIYPDGYHVHCESLNGKLTLDFYQSGCFTAMIEDIEIIGKAKVKWVIEDIYHD